MSRKKGTTEEEAEAMALQFVAAQHQAAAPFSMIPNHGLTGMPMMGMGMGLGMGMTFFPTMGMNPGVAAMMAENHRQQQTQAAAFSHAAFGIPHNNMMTLNSTQTQVVPLKPPPAQPRVVHDAANAPRPVKVPQPKRGPGRPVGSSNNRLKQNIDHMKECLLNSGSRLGKDPQTEFPYFSDSPTLDSQDSDDVSIQDVNSAPSAPAIQAAVFFGTGRPEMPPPKWYTSCLPLGLEDDKFYLSELQCLLRSDFIEVFGTTEMEIDIQSQSRNKPLVLGQVGLRCMYCKDLPLCVRAINSTLYPTSMSAIYNAVQGMYRMHFGKCDGVPAELKSKVTTFETHNTSNRGGRKHYWVESAKRLGLVDTQFGIHFGRDPSLPLPPFVACASQEDEDMVESKPVQKEPEYYPLVLPEDKDLVTDYLYLAMEQMQPCNLMDADRVGCYKGRKTGFPGLACKHCVGQAGCGRYFPASEASLSQTTTSQTIINHVRNCRRCPIDIREQLEFMKMAKTVSKKGDKPKHGGRKVFFRRLWCRIQRLPITEDEPDATEKEYWENNRRKNSDAESSPEAKKRKRAEPETEELNDSTISQDDSTRNEVVRKKKTGRKYVLDGKILLAKGDDCHWLSQAERYTRLELVEVFTAVKDDKNEFGGPEVGQVGIRCTYCTKTMPKDQRVKGHVSYPTSVSAIQQCVKDLQSRHIAICGNIPDVCREQLRSLKGYGSKPAGDTAQYWIDSAKELGLEDSPDGIGVIFCRNPRTKTPADCLDIEKTEGLPTGSFLMRAEDRVHVTDSMALLLKQFRPCRFQTSDRRGSRSRDRALGSPGIYCVHCAKKRYFPVTEKKLIDTLVLMKTHMRSCPNVPVDVEASLCYLSHRSLLQKAELGGQWKSKIFKKVWDRLHHEDWSDFDYSNPGIVEAFSAREEEGQTEDSAVVPKSDSMEETDYTTSIYAENQSTDDAEEEEEDDRAEELTGMQELIKAAAIWLCERDAELEIKQARSKGLGKAKSLPLHRGGRGGGRGGRLRTSSTTGTG